MRLRFFHIKKSIFYRGKLTIRFPIRPQACPDPFERFLNPAKGLFYLATNVDEYIKWTRELIENESVLDHIR